MSALREKASIIAEKRRELVMLEQSANTGERDPVDGGMVLDVTKSQIEEIRNRTSELNRLQEEYEAAEAAEMLTKNREELTRMQQPNRLYPVATGGSIDLADRKAVTRQLLEQGRPLSYFIEQSEIYKNRKNLGRRYGIDLPDIDMKTLLQTTAGFAPANPRTGIVILSAQRRPVVADLIPQDPTDLSSIKYMEETTATNAARNVSEGTEKPESALAYTERTATVEKVATWIPATEEQLDDVPQMRNLIDNRLTLFVLLAEEDDLLNGNGSGKIDGFLHKSGLQTQAFNTNNADTVYMGMTKVEGATSFAVPSGIVLHPNNWQTIRLAKASGSGEYIIGAPTNTGTQASGAVTYDGVERLWGLPVVKTTAITAGTGLVGAFSTFAHISRKSGLRIDVSDSHSTYFIENKLAIRAEERLSLEIYRPAAFCTLTSLT